MSTSPYSQDLRNKVIGFLEAGGSQRAAAKLFKMSKTTVNKWNLRYKNEGHVMPRKRLGLKPKVNALDFANYISTFSEIKPENIAKHFSISINAVRYKLRQLGYSYKKKRIPTWKLVLKNEQNLTKS